ncbi:MAG: response regulator [Candidatus Aminicenantes bacterium]|nr:MAG: response regulator [Candidatus Aminicenantes bacterium]
MKLKILIIDDDRVTLTMLEMILSRHGYHVLSARDGAEGLEIASKEKPDVVLSDMLIPKIHGLDLCTKIKQDPQLKDIKVILMTAVYKGAAFQFEAKESGADHFIEKPINTNELIEKLDKLLTIS